MYFPAGINQGLAAALRAPPSGLFIALVIQVPAGTALVGVAQRQQVCLRVEMRQRKQVKESESKCEKVKVETKKNGNKC